MPSTVRIMALLSALSLLVKKGATLTILALYGFYLVSQGLSQLASVAKPLHASACGVPVISSWLSCPLLADDFPARKVHQLPTVISDPVSACNIFGATVAAGHKISDYIPTMSFAANLATNISLWSSPSSPAEITSDSVRATIPELNAVATELHDLLGESHSAYQLAQSTFIHWDLVVRRQSSRRGLSAAVSRSLHRWYYRKAPRLAADLVDELEGSLAFLNRTIHDVRLRFDDGRQRVTDLHLAFSETSQTARREEWTISSAAKRSWLPRSLTDIDQEDLRRQVRLEASYAACALEYALGALRRISAALLALKELPQHAALDSVTDVGIALQTLQLHAEALNDANAGLQDMLL